MTMELELMIEELEAKIAPSVCGGDTGGPNGEDLPLLPL
jgi:hypothetical protein